MTKTKLIAFTLPAVLLAGGTFAYWHWTHTPTYSLRQIQKALETHDVAKFEKHVDIQSVSSRLIDDMMSHALKETQPQSGAEGLGTALAAGLVQLMKPRLVEAIREQAVRLVEQGDLGRSISATNENESGKVSLQAMSEEVGAGEDSFRGIKYVKKQGKIALVGLGFRNAELDADLVLELKMRDMGGYWQLAEFSNLIDLLQEITSLQTARLAEVNEPIRQEISQTLQVDRAKKTNRSDRWGISKYVAIEISVRNKSTREVTGFSAAIRLLDSTGELVKEVNISDNDRIAPSKTGRGVWRIDVNMFDASDNRLYDLPSEQVRFEVAFKRVVFGDGSELKLFESLDEASRQE
jgi:hypothetical protein